MKKYEQFCESDRNQAMQRQLEALRIFQYLLRNNTQLNSLYQNKAGEIAEGLQPWIDALEIQLEE